MTLFEVRMPFSFFGGGDGVQKSDAGVGIGALTGDRDYIA